MPTIIRVYILNNGGLGHTLLRRVMEIDRQATQAKSGSLHPPEVTFCQKLRKTLRHTSRLALFAKRTRHNRRKKISLFQLLPTLDRPWGVSLWILLPDFQRSRVHYHFGGGLAISKVSNRFSCPACMSYRRGSLLVHKKNVQVWAFSGIS